MKSALSIPRLLPQSGVTDVRVAFVLLPALLVTLLHRDLCAVDALPATGLLADMSIRVWTYYACTFLLFGAVPLMIVKGVLHEQPVEYGLRVGDWRFGLPLTVLLLAGFAILTFAAPAGLDSLRRVYPVDPGAMDSPALFLRHATLRLVLFYTAWEFLFRGFLLQGLRGTVSDATAVMIQTLPSALWHIGYPTSEIYASVAGGLLFGWLALRTRSLLWPLLLHAGVGIITDLAITLTR